MRVRKYLYSALLILFALFSYDANGQACTCTSTGVTSDWTLATTWSCAGAGCASTPRVNGTWPYDNVVINHSVTRSSGLTMVGGSPGADLTVNGTLTITGNNNITVGNWGDPTVTINSGGTIDIQGSGNLNLTGADAFTLNSGGTLNARSFSVSGGAGGAITVNGTMTLSNNFVIGSDRTVNMNGANLTVGNTLRVGSAVGVLNSTNSSINVTNNLDIIGSGVFGHTGSNLTIGGDFNNTGAVATNIGGAVSITGDVNNTGSSDLTFSGNATVGGNVIGTGGTSIIVDGTLDVTGAIDISGSAQLEGSGVVGFGSFTTDNSGSKMNCTTGTNHDTDAGSADTPPPHNPMDLTTCGPGVILPVELLYFTGADAGDHILLNWATVTEENNAYFTVLRSIDGINFYPIGQVDGAGNSQSLITYSLIDPNYSSAYYQLVQTDIDGRYTTSNIIFVKVDQSSISIYPNPTNGQEINILFGSPAQGDLLYNLYDLTGHMILENTVQMSSSLKHTIHSSSYLANGVYILSITHNGETNHFRVVVN